MCSRDETVKAILTFYRQLIRHPHLDETALKIPPASGWDNIDQEALQAIGKTDTVIDLLRHLPYFDGRGTGCLIAYETVPVDLTIESTAMTEEVYPIPGHCVYPTEGLSRIPSDCTTTAFSIMDYELSTADRIDHENQPEIEQWRAHRTLPTTEFFAAWTLRYEKLVWFMSPRSYLAAGEFHFRAQSRQQEEEVSHQELTEWIPDASEAVEIEDEDAREWKLLNIKYPTDVYNTYLRYGWGSEKFDKQACRVMLLEMGKAFSRERNRLMDKNDPDADMFD